MRKGSTTTVGEQIAALRALATLADAVGKAEREQRADRLLPARQTRGPRARCRSTARQPLQRRLERSRTALYALERSSICSLAARHPAQQLEPGTQIRIVRARAVSQQIPLREDGREPRP